MFVQLLFYILYYLILFLLLFSCQMQLFLSLKGGFIFREKCEIFRFTIRTQFALNYGYDRGLTVKLRDTKRESVLTTLSISKSV
jgi:hypothetical protein